MALDLRRATPLAIAFVLSLLYASTFNHFLNGFIHDEFRVLGVVQGMQEYGVPMFLDRNYYQHPPLLYSSILLLSGLMPVDLAATLVELGSAFGTLVFFYLLAERLLNRRAAILGTVILGTHPNVWVWSNRFLHEAPLLLFFTATIYLFTRAMENNNLESWIVLGFVLGLGFNLKISTFLAGVCIVAHMVLTGRLMNLSDGIKLKVNDFTMLVLAGAVALAAYTPYFVYTYVNNAPSPTQIFGREIAGAAAFSLPQPWYFYIVEFPNFLNLALTPLFLYGLVAAVAKKEKGLLSYMVWFLVPVLFFTIPLYKVYRYVNPLFPVLVLFASRGLTAHPSEVHSLLCGRDRERLEAELNILDKDERAIQRAHEFLWSLRGKVFSWSAVPPLLEQARATGVSAAEFVRSLKPKAERFVLDTEPELELGLEQDIAETVETKRRQLASMAEGYDVPPIAQVAVVLLIAFFGTYQSLSTVLNDGAWPVDYGAWEVINSLDSNGVLLAQDKWWAANFFTDSFVEYLYGETGPDYDHIARYNAKYIVAHPDWEYIGGNPLFKPVQTLPELNSTLYQVNWSVMSAISTYTKFELSVLSGSRAWLILENQTIGRVPSTGNFTGFLPDNRSYKLHIRRVCRSPQELYFKLENGRTLQCMDMWLNCGEVDHLEVQMYDAPCFYHPGFVLDRF